MGFVIIKKYFKNGNNSRRLLIQDGNKKYVIKMTDTNETLNLHKYVPKSYSIKTATFNFFNKDGFSYVYKYQFIQGKELNKVIIDDDIFLNLIKMCKYINTRHYLIWDFNPANIVITKEKDVFFVDLGGISRLPMTGVYYPIIFSPGVEPDEWKSPMFPETLKTEQFSIYYLSHILINECSTKLSKASHSVLVKMNQMSISNRYKRFNDIYKELAKQSKKTSR